MSSLVAYYGSSDEEEEEMETENKNVAERGRPASAVTLAPRPQQQEPETSLGLGSLLPKPKGSQLDTTSVEIGPIPPSKTYGDEESPVPVPGPGSSTSRSFTFPGFSTKKSASGIMQISIPSLKDFKDENDATKKKQFNSSQKGSGLFAILPEPKSEVSFRLPAASTSGEIEKKSAEQLSAETELASSLAPNMMSLNLAKPKSVPLIPHVVHQSIIGKRPAATNDRLAQVRAKYMKQESNFKIVSRSTSATASGDKKRKEKDDEDDSEDEDSGTDFFSLDSKKYNFEHMKDFVGDESEGFGKDSAIGMGYTEEYSMSMEQEQAEALPAPSFQDNEPDVTPGPAQPDLMQYIQPKRGRGKNEPINIIDVSADDLRPSSTDWIKTITDKSAMPPRKNNLPGGMMKRKHQITYLAAEAKAREEELQNQWAQNRTARRATQSKYGF